jgi:hypothetical protein
VQPVRARVPPPPPGATQLGRRARSVVSLHLRTLAREGRMTVTIGRREMLAALGGAASLFFCVNAAAQEGYYGAGHDKWHQGFQGGGASARRG